jgi:hypothetical protein
VETYQAKTALDVENLRKVLAVALKDEAKLGMDVVKSGAATPAGPGVAGVPLDVTFHWRNNAGVNKKKEAAVRLELSRTAAGWRLGACRATEKVSF